MPESIGIEYQSRRKESGLLELYSLMLVIGLVQSIITIVASGYTCGALCCPKDKSLIITKETIRMSFSKKTMMILSILQIICGCLAILLQVWANNISFFISNIDFHYFFKNTLFQILQYVVGDEYQNIYVIGWGTWTGIIFAISGIFGLIGALKPSKCM